MLAQHVGKSDDCAQLQGPRALALCHLCGAPVAHLRIGDRRRGAVTHQDQIPLQPTEFCFERVFGMLLHPCVRVREFTLGIFQLTAAQVHRDERAGDPRRAQGRARRTPCFRRNPEPFEQCILGSEFEPRPGRDHRGEGPFLRKSETFRQLERARRVIEGRCGIQAVGIAERLCERTPEPAAGVNVVRVRN